MAGQGETTNAAHHHHQRGYPTWREHSQSYDRVCRTKVPCASWRQNMADWPWALAPNARAGRCAHILLHVLLSIDRPPSSIFYFVSSLRTHARFGTASARRLISPLVFSSTSPSSTRRRRAHIPPRLANHFRPSALLLTTEPITVDPNPPSRRTLKSSFASPNKDAPITSPTRRFFVHPPRLIDNLWTMAL